MCHYFMKLYTRIFTVDVAGIYTKHTHWNWLSSSRKFIEVWFFTSTYFCHNGIINNCNGKWHIHLLHYFLPPICGNYNGYPTSIWQRYTFFAIKFTVSLSSHFIKGILTTVFYVGSPSLIHHMQGWLTT